MPAEAVSGLYRSKKSRPLGEDTLSLQAVERCPGVTIEVWLSTHIFHYQPILASSKVPGIQTITIANNVTQLKTH